MWRPGLDDDVLLSPCVLRRRRWRGSGGEPDCGAICARGGSERASLGGGCDDVVVRW